MSRRNQHRPSRSLHLRFERLHRIRRRVLKGASQRMANHGKIPAHQAGFNFILGLTLESATRQIAIRMKAQEAPARLADNSDLA